MLVDYNPVADFVAHLAVAAGVVAALYTAYGLAEWIVDRPSRSQRIRITERHDV
jgi:energy-converting hydrogenase Eha subunit A